MNNQPPDWKLESQAPEVPLWKLEKVIIGGQRYSGNARGKSEDEALRRFVSPIAKGRKIDAGLAIHIARQDPYKKISKVSQTVDDMLPEAPRNFTNWPAEIRRKDSHKDSHKDF